MSLVASLDPGVFRNRNLQNALVNKQSAAARGGAGDGCAVSGAPDRNDWIVTCDAQQEVYATLVRNLEELVELLPAGEP